jgi:exopolysaccharide biosynthesis polyprenyl glycosylphosphotransferase
VRLKKSKITFFLVTMFSDALFILVAFALAYWLRFYAGIFEPGSTIPRFSSYILGSFFVMAVWIFIFYMFNLYDTKRNLNLIDEFYETAKATVVGVIIVLAPTFFYRAFTFSRIVFVMACGIGLVLIWIGRAFVHRGKIWLHQQGYSLRRIAIVGGGQWGTTLVDRVQVNPGLGYRIVGQIVDQVGTEIQDLRVLGSVDDIHNIVLREKLDTLIMTFPLRSHHKVTKILAQCNGLPLDLRFVPDIYEILTSRVNFYEIDGIPLIKLKELPLADPWNRLTKRCVDIILSTLLILFSAPLMGVIAVLIKLSSRGPVFYRQERVGEDGAIYRICKFRSMNHEAERETGPVWASDDDARCTRVGRIIRKLSLDELPQLFNVLKGEMSLIGPRPERPCFVEKFMEEIPRYPERHTVKSGITGWAQVNGLRGNTSLDERIRHDLYYIENWSLGFDLKILARTVLEMLRSKSAC